MYNVNHFYPFVIATQVSHCEGVVTTETISMSGIASLRPVTNFADINFAYKFVTGLRSQ